MVDPNKAIFLVLLVQLISSVAGIIHLGEKFEDYKGGYQQRCIDD